MLFARLRDDALLLQVPLTKQHVKRAVLHNSLISVPISVLSWLLF